MAAVERNRTIDIIRGLAMIAVVYGHALEVFAGGFSAAALEAHRLIYSFHMPAFYFVSGMASSRIRSESLRKMLSSALTLIVLADLTHLIAAPLYAGISLSEGMGANLIAERVFYPLLAGYGFLLVPNWFLVSLAFGKLLSWCYLRGGPFLKAFLWVALIVLYLFAARFDFRFFEIQTWMAALAFILLGNEALRFKCNLQAMSLKLCIALLLAAGAALFFSYGLNRGCLLHPMQSCNVDPQYRNFGVEVIYGHLGFLPLFFLTALLGITMLVLLGSAMEKTPAAAAMAWVGRNTLALMILNGFVRFFLSLLSPRYFPAFSSLMGSAGIAAVQVAILPLVLPVMKRIQDQSRRIADIFLDFPWKARIEKTEAS